MYSFFFFMLQYEKLVVEPATTLKPKPDVNSLVFGAEFTDHMLGVEWDVNHGWGEPKITPYQNFSLAPSCSTFHYALEVICKPELRSWFSDYSVWKIHFLTGNTFKQLSDGCENFI